MLCMRPSMLFIFQLCSGQRFVGHELALIVCKHAANHEIQVIDTQTYRHEAEITLMPLNAAD